MTTPLPSRLRASAQEMRTLDGVSLRPSTLALIDRESAVRIAAELTEAADALEAGPPDRWVVVRETALDIGFGDDVRTGGRPELGYALLANAATFASADEARAAIRKGIPLPLGWVLMPLSRLLPDVVLAAAPAAQVAQEGGGVATRHPRCGYPYCACVGQCFAASQPGAHGVATDGGQQ